MQLNQLKPIHKKKTKKRVGRGGKKGTFSGRGIKGQKARSNTRFKPIIRDLIKRYPKLRGYRFNIKPSNCVVLNLEIFNKKFEEKEKVNPQLLFERGIIRKIKGKIPRVKILGKGEIKKALIFEDFQFSKGVKEKIEKAGGTIK